MQAQGGLASRACPVGTYCRTSSVIALNIGAARRKTRMREFVLVIKY